MYINSKESQKTRGQKMNPKYLQTSRETYCKLLNHMKQENPKIAMNLSEPPTDKETIFYSFNGACSYLLNGYMGGLFKYDKHFSNCAKDHQSTRILNGGYFLECYEPLAELYRKQGFEIVAEIPFNEEFAPKDWQDDAHLAKKPKVVFMSLYGQGGVLKTNDYDKAFQFAKNTKK